MKQVPTPRPWSLGEPVQVVLADGLEPSRLVMFGRIGPLAADFVGGIIVENEVGEANARLAIAAPELVDLLRVFLREQARGRWAPLSALEHRARFLLDSIGVLTPPSGGTVSVPSSAATQALEIRRDQALGEVEPQQTDGVTPPASPARGADLPCVEGKYYAHTVCVHCGRDLEPAVDVDRCPVCHEPCHASEGDDEGRHPQCQERASDPACTCGGEVGGHDCLPTCARCVEVTP